MRQTSWVAVGVIASLLLSVVTGTAGVTVQVEGEAYVDTYDLGGLPFSKSFCSAASEWYAADGLDIPSEWLELEIAVPLTGHYQPLVGYQVEYQDSSAVRVTVMDEQSPEVNRVSDFSLSEGWGFG